MRELDKELSQKLLKYLNKKGEFIILNNMLHTYPFKAPV